MVHGVGYDILIDCITVIQSFCDQKLEYFDDIVYDYGEKAI